MPKGSLVRIMEGPRMPAVLATASLLISSVSSVAILILSAQEWASSESFVVEISGARPTVSILVQLFSQTLGLLQVSSLCAVLALSFRCYAAKSSFSLYWLQFVNLVHSTAFRWDLPWRYFLALCAFIVFSLVPAAVWSGAITPTIITINETVPYVIPLIENARLSTNPLFNAGAGNQKGYTGHCTIIRDNATVLDPTARAANASSRDGYGSFHFCFNSLRPALLYSAAHASSSVRTPTQQLSVRRKLDLSGYSYLGRSYGVGMGVGITGIPDAKNPLSLIFHEQGILTTVACSRNSSSIFRINCTSDPSPTCTTITRGTLPEGRDASLGTSEFFNTDYSNSAFLSNDVMSWGSDYQNSSSTTWISIATGYNKTDVRDLYSFAEFDKTQCLLSFQAAEFQVAVDVSTKTMVVSPTAAKVAWPSHADVVLTELSTEHNYISYNNGNNAGSQLGHALRSNLNSLRALSGVPGSDRDDDSLLRSLEDFFADLMDNSLIAYNEAMLIGQNSRQTVEAIVSRHAVRFGSPTFVYAAFAINVIFLGVFIFEAWRTHWWHDISGLDLNSIASVVVGASAGGSTLSSFVGKTENVTSESQDGWEMQNAAVDIRRARLRVKRVEPGQLALVLADGDVSEEIALINVG
ncbi:hypothetical protein B0T16DRAFT_389320 [Cercophora newfieldiana]|uniref:Uncharacterized protein n=1 Tax=Cercophora newfieldiana TaxID=92897 RepID=A0AA40CS68_9PEZI|nr:hypothetical protein B0T16DRAFT_389320 [Cercophora newfieldiana]